MTFTKKFEIVDEHNVLTALEKGYEIIHSWAATYNNTQSVNGTFMGNSISANVPTQNNMQKFIMKRSPQAEVLFGDKNENKPANT